MRNAAADKAVDADKGPKGPNAATDEAGEADEGPNDKADEARRLDASRINS